MSMVKTAAVFGYGYWGKKVVQALETIGFSVSVVDPKKLQGIAQLPQQRVLEDPSMPYCFIITPEETHFDLTLSCLQHGKHVFVEKPLALQKSQAVQLTELAVQQQRKLWADHVLLFDPAFSFFLQQFRQHQWQQPHFTVRRYSNLQIKKNVSIFADILPHDIYLIEALIPEFWQSFQIQKKSADEKKAELLLKSASGGHLQASYRWFAPEKQKEFSVQDRNRKIVWQTEHGKETVSVWEGGNLVTQQSFLLQFPTPIEKMLRHFLSNEVFDFQQLVRETAVLETVIHF